jgi:hypothetical protein
MTNKPKLTTVGVGKLRHRKRDNKPYLEVKATLAGKEWTLLVYRANEDGQSWDVLCPHASAQDKPPDDQDEYSQRTGRSIDGRRTWQEDNSEAPF